MARCREPFVRVSAVCRPCRNAKLYNPAELRVVSRVGLPTQEEMAWGNADTENCGNMSSYHSSGFGMIRPVSEGVAQRAVPLISASSLIFPPRHRHTHIRANHNSVYCANDKDKSCGAAGMWSSVRL
jgi:hypothetical protein